MKKINYDPFPILETERFRLRQLTDEDAEKIFLLRSDERVTKYLDHPIAKSISEAEAFIEKINLGIKNNEWIMWGIEFMEGNNFAGTICLWNFLFEEAKADIGFTLLPEAMGRGIIQEVTPLILNYGFNELGLDMIEGETAAGNIKSIKLMQSFGFEFSRKQENTNVYSIRGSDYLQNKLNR